MKNSILSFLLALTMSISGGLLLQSCTDDSQVQVDTDNDGVADSVDNCPNTPNPTQGDTDGDGIGDVCEADADNDGIADDIDNCLNTPNANQADADNDGIGDACEADTDGDGIADDTDNCLNTPNSNQEDLDEDGIGDACDDSVIVPLSKCVDGMAGNYPCNGYDLAAYFNLSELGGGSTGNDSWGWTDTASGREFALIGTSSVMSFVEITDFYNPLVIGFLSTATGNSLWRDVKVYKDHAFIVSEASGHGMQVFDLTRLLNVAEADMPVSFSADARYTEFGNAHNIAINEDTGFAYAIGTNTYAGGPHIVDISDPKNPVRVGGFSAGGYSHDAQIVTYNGPDTDYTGREIFIGSNADEIVIADITDKSDIKIISTATYANIGYTHQGWFTTDQKYFILGDELDESNFGFKTRTLFFDFSDLDAPTLANTYFATTSSIDHNLYVKGNVMYQANYTSGVRMVDISDVQNPEEIGYFDTYPSNDNASFNGAWNVYPYFPSGTIIVSDYNRGVFILRKQQ